MLWLISGLRLGNPKLKGESNMASLAIQPRRRFAAGRYSDETRLARIVDRIVTGLASVSLVDMKLYHLDQDSRETQRTG